MSPFVKNKTSRFTYAWIGSVEADTFSQRPLYRPISTVNRHSDSRCQRSVGFMIAMTQILTCQNSSGVVEQIEGSIFQKAVRGALSAEFHIVYIIVNIITPSTHMSLGVDQ